VTEVNFSAGGSGSNEVIWECIQVRYTHRASCNAVCCKMARACNRFLKSIYMFSVFLEFNDFK